MNQTVPSVKLICRSLIQRITYISTAAHFSPSKPIDECEIWDPITRRYENRRTENLRKKDIKSVSFVQCKPKTHHNKIHAPVTTWPQEQFGNPSPILTHQCFHKHTSQRFSSEKTCKISNLSKSLIAGNDVYLNCNSFLALQTDWWVRDMRPNYSSMWK